VKVAPYWARLSRGIDRLNDYIGSIIRWLALVMVLVGAATAVLRFASGQLGFSINLTPPTEVQWYLFSVIFLLGAAYGLRCNAHVRVDVLYERLSERTQALIDFLGGIIFLLPFSGAMLYYSWRPVRNSFQIREISPDPGGLPRWPIKALIIVSFVLLAVQGIVQVARSAGVVFGSGRQETAASAAEGGTVAEEASAVTGPQA